jgi:formimidoylglutamate deiminase
LRGHGEDFPEGAGSFWTWREAMYDLVGRMDAETMYDLSLRAFSEMLAAGMTTVGEFHYLHHDHTGRGYAFDEVVLRAAGDAGIRIVLLNTFYRTGGIGVALSGAQRRFRSGSVAEYLQQLDRLAKGIHARTQSLGVVAHSIRAATIDEIAELYAEARRRELVFHMHVEEQRKEMEDCRSAYGKTPMELLTERLEIGNGFTAVHCTHTEPGQMRRFLSAGGRVCMCPITEGNLGDGIADLPGILAAGGSVCVGTDLNSRLSMTEELRWLEYVQRLRHETRGVCADKTGRTDRALLRAATICGADSLGVPAGIIAPDYLADFVAIDLNAPALAGWTQDSLLTAFIFGCGPEVVASTCVGGDWKHHRNLG